MPNIALVSTTASEIPGLCKVDEHVRGYSGFACMFPNDKTWNVLPGGFDKIDDKVDVVIFIPSSQPELLEQMIAIAERFEGRCLVQDCDPPTGWLQWFPQVTKLTVDLFNACDTVVTHSNNMVPVVQQFTKTPVVYLPEPNYLASHKDKLKRRKNGMIVAVTTHCATYNSARNAVINYAVMKGIMEQLPNRDYAVIANTTTAGAGSMYATEAELLESFHMPQRVKFLSPKNRLDMFELYAQIAMFINMDFSNAVGHWQIDSAAAQIPMICSIFPDASRRLFPKLSFLPYEVDEAGTMAIKILSNRKFYQAITDYAHKAVDNYSYAHVRETFCRIIEQPVPHIETEHTLESDDSPIVVELGAGGKLHEDATCGLDIRPHDIPGKKFIQHDLTDLPLPFRSNSVSKAYLCHSLEHLPRHEAVALMQDVHRMLKAGGLVHIEVPNVSKAFEFAVETYPDIEAERLEGIAWESVTKTLWSDSSRSPYDRHAYGWNHFTLKRMLHGIGFDIDNENSEKTWAVILTARKSEKAVTI